MRLMVPGQAPRYLLDSERFQEVERVEKGPHTGTSSSALCRKVSRFGERRTADSNGSRSDVYPDEHCRRSGPAKPQGFRPVSLYGAKLGIGARVSHSRRSRSATALDKRFFRLI